MKAERWPNLFIIGAPKAGTTTVYKWLHDHPDVFMSQPKEPMFFCNIRHSFKGPGAESLNKMIVCEENKYLGLFENAAKYRYRGEGSTDYLSWPGTPERISSKSPHAAMIVLLRNPVERAYSEHMHLVRDRHELSTFEYALDHEDRRLNQGWNTLFGHVKRSLYSEQLRHYLELFGRENIFIGLYDDLKTDPGRVYYSICDFLNIRPIKMDFSIRYNKSGILRSLVVDDLTRGRIMPGWLKQSAIRIIGRRRVEVFVQQIQEANRRKIQMNHKEKHRLIEIFRGDVRETSRIIGRDLSEWLSI